MESYLFKQLSFVRHQTISHVDGINDDISHHIPEGFNNNIKWNLGHIYVVQENFAFGHLKDKMFIPRNFKNYFGPGTKPEYWDATVPDIYELIQLLKNQVIRVEATLENQLKKSFLKSYVTSTRMELTTLEEFLSFCLYHEGMHFDAIKSIKRTIKFD